MCSLRQDQIKLFGIKIRPRIGVTPGERRLPQPCVADVLLQGDFESAATSDSLDRAINYSVVLRKVQEVAASREFNLLETLAYALAREIQTGFQAQKVRIRVRKRPMSLVEKLDCIEVEIEIP
jgi:7,8-dihydroneopterin aldolase/epimerase/oxygenase